MGNELPKVTFSKPCQTVGVQQFLYLTRGIEIERRIAWLQTFHPDCLEGGCKFETDGVENESVHMLKCTTHNVRLRYYE